MRQRVRAVHVVKKKARGKMNGGQKEVTQVHHEKRIFGFFFLC
jgi:hypothetical protein